MKNAKTKKLNDKKLGKNYGFEYNDPIKLHRFSYAEIKQKICELVSQEGWNYGIPTIASVLLGTRSKTVLSRGLDANDLFGVFKDESLTETDITIVIDDLLNDKKSGIIKDRQSGIVTLATKRNDMPIINFLKRNSASNNIVFESKKTEGPELINTFSKADKNLLVWFDGLSNNYNKSSKPVSEKTFYGYKAQGGRYWLTIEKETKELVFKYKMNECSEIGTIPLSEKNKSRIGLIIIRLSMKEKTH